MRHYARPDLLAIDEVGYLAYSNRHADLVFELVSCRYKSTMITTYRSFSENSEVIEIDGEFYRLKEAQERNEQRASKRRKEITLVET